MMEKKMLNQTTPVNLLQSVLNQLNMLKGDGKTAHEMANTKALIQILIRAIEKKPEIAIKKEKAIKDALKRADKLIKPKKDFKRRQSGRERNTSVVGFFHNLGKGESIKISKRILNMMEKK